MKKNAFIYAALAFGIAMVVLGRFSRRTDSELPVVPFFVLGILALLCVAAAYVVQQRNRRGQ